MSSPEHNEINWRQELDDVGMTNWSYVCQTLEETETFLRASIYELLTGKTYKEQAQPDEGNPTTQAINTLAEASHAASEREGFESEWQEAVAVGQEAIQVLDQERYYEKSYQYIMTASGPRAIRDKISVEVRERNNRDYYVVFAPMMQVGERNAFPGHLLHQESSLTEVTGEVLDSRAFLRDKISLFHQPGTDVEQEVFDHATLSHFAAVVKEMPFEDRATQSEFLWQIELLKFRIQSSTTAAQLFDQLSPEQRLLASQPRVHEVWYQFKHMIDADDALVEMWMGVNLENVTAFYDSKTQRMKGEVGSSEDDMCRMMLFNKHHPNTTHEGLLAVRHRARAICEALGIRL